MESALYKKIKDYQNCLSHLRMPDESAYRKTKDLSGAILPGETPFGQDRYRLLNSRALRRIARVCQVFPTPENTYIRNRLTHTLEVESVAVKIARILGLNMELCSAAALGHDIGHVPFGHVGEDFISEKTGRRFRHGLFSVIVAQQIERNGRGLNLTKQTLEGMLNHSRGNGKLYLSEIPEYDAVMLADKLAYILISDIEDIIRQGNLKIKHFPEIFKIIKSFGANPFQRINTCIAHLCLESAKKGRFSFTESPVAQRFDELKDLAHIAYKKINRIERKLCPQFLNNAYKNIEITDINTNPILVIALMTDYDVMALSDIRLSSKEAAKILRGLSVWEIIHTLRVKNIDFSNPRLKW